MRQIWKFPLAPDQIFIEIPKGAEILTVQVQHGAPCIWAIVNPLEEKEKKQIRIIPTGVDIEGDTKGLKYYGTFQIQTQRGLLIFHVFEVLPPVITNPLK